MTLLEKLNSANVAVGVGSAPAGGGILTALGNPTINEYVTIPDDKHGKGQDFFVEIAKKSGIVTHRDLHDATKTDEKGNRTLIDREEFLVAWQGERYRIVVDGE